MSDPLITPWTVARQAPLSVGFPMKEHWSGLPFPSPGDFPDLEIKPTSPALAGEFLTTDPLGKPTKLDTAGNNPFKVNGQQNFMFFPADRCRRQWCQTKLGPTRPPMY